MKTVSYALVWAALEKCALQAERSVRYSFVEMEKDGV